MKYIIKTFGLISLATVVCGANAAVSRVSMVSNASRRIPSLPAGYMVSGSTTSASTAITFSDTECIDTYTACLKRNDVCGADMEECTTKILLHAKMPNCLSTLYQCSSNGVASLFGTSNVADLSKHTESNGEIVSYTYPTDGSVLGQMVEGAHLSNLLPTDQCVRRYTNCVKRDNVCGEHFELCTDDKEFKNQSIECDSVYARCQNAGLKELFGDGTRAQPAEGSRIKELIKNGAQYAAANAVKTCYNVVDACLVNACTGNPWRCVEGANMSTITSADFIAGGLTGDTTSTSTLSIGEDGNVTSDYDLYALTTNQEVRKFIKGKCLSAIGGNKSCYMTFLERVPKDKDLADIDNQEDVFSLAYAARKEFANAKIQDALKTFDKRAKDNCIKTITECVKRSCGKGLGTLCYQNSRDTDGSIHVNNSKNYKDIKAGCKAIVDTDANCQYAANSGTDDGYMYAYVDDSVFSKLFPEYSVGTGTGTGTASGTVTPSRGVNADDPLGAIASLNAMLATSYNDGALANLKKQCQTTALSCVRSMCGTDYVNCYRNRTDIVATGTGAYDTGKNRLDYSMNKMGGILDYNIVIGLCMNTVKTSSVCEEHLKLATQDWIENQDTESWGLNTTVRDAWYGSNATQVNTTDNINNVVVGCRASYSDPTSGECTETVEPRNGQCGILGEDGCVYDIAVTVSSAEYALESGAKTLFQQLLVDVEREVQAKYNAKLTKEQNMCLANNNGGIMGAGDQGSTFQWVKLKSNKTPSNYAAKGLSTSQFTTSNDLYGSFCRAKITIMSDDKAIQDNLGGESVAYFAVGDPFTCGSWIGQSTLDKISKAVGDAAYNREKDRNKRGDEIERRWWTIGSALVGGVGGYAGMDALQRGNGTLGGLLNPSKNSYTTTNTKNSEGQSCLDDIASAEQSYARVTKNIYGKPSDDAAAHYYNKAVQQANSALSHARKGKANVSGIEFVPLYGYISGTPDTYEWVGSDNVALYANTMLTTYGDFCNQKCIASATEARVNLGLNATSENASKIEASLIIAAEEIINEATKVKGIQSVSDATKAKADSAISNMTKIIQDSNNLLTVKENKGKESALATLPTSTDTNGNDTLQSFQSSLSDLKDECQKLVDATENTSGRLTKNLIAGVAGAGLSALTAYHIVDDTQKLKYSKAEQEAIDQWMNEVGSHIKCYLGGEELGSYGDVISFELN